jgi:N-acetylneuraminate synthase/N,N'-diacetyllegionaminate synthase
MRTYIIAEAGVNHNGDINIAHKLIEEAKNSGADCLKFQTFKAENLVTREAPKANYQLKVTDNNESQYEMLKSLELNYDDYKELIEHSKSLDIDFMSTPYSYEDVDFLMKLNVDSFKIASGQLTERPFLDYVSKTKKPIFLSSGMSTMEDVLLAVETISSNSNEKLTVFQCTTNYPSEISEANINVIESFKKITNIEVGYSDHVTNNYACYAAVAKGVSAVEKHFTLDKSLPGPDHSCSLNPDELKELVYGIREIEKSLGSFKKEPSKSEKKNIYGMKRSLVYKKTLKKGTKLSMLDFAFKRPMSGLLPNDIDSFVGKELLKDVIKDELADFKHIS